MFERLRTEKNNVCLGFSQVLSKQKQRQKMFNVNTQQILLFFKGKALNYITEKKKKKEFRNKV